MTNYLRVCYKMLRSLKTELILSYFKLRIKKQNKKTVSFYKTEESWSQMGHVNVTTPEGPVHGTPVDHQQRNMWDSSWSLAAKLFLALIM